MDALCTLGWISFGLLLTGVSFVCFAFGVGAAWHTAMQYHKKRADRHSEDHRELLEIHKIACCGWSNGVAAPNPECNTMTVRGVRDMACGCINCRINK
jgi:hypothetical protein